MKLVIAGGTGFLGNALAWAWAEEGHDVRVLTRRCRPARRSTSRAPASPALRASAGSLTAPPAPRRASSTAPRASSTSPASRSPAAWTPARKQALRDSRHLATRRWSRPSPSAAAAPPTFISGSAVGYYGDRGSEPLTEDSSAGTDFLAQLCVDWEAEAQRAAAPGLRVVLLRTGLVLERSGGALRKMMLPFRFFAGGPIGSGRQVHAVDPSPRLDRDGALDRRHAGDVRPGERRPRRTRSPTAIRARARPRAAPPGAGARAGLRACDRARRDGRRRPRRPARAPRARARARAFTSATPRSTSRSGESSATK